MPVPKKRFLSFGLHRLLKNFSLRFFLVLSLVLLGLYAVVVQTQNRVVHSGDYEGQQLNANLINNEISSQNSQPPSKKHKGIENPKVAFTQNQDKDEWCEAKEYRDLSKDPVFKNFNRWFSDYSQLICNLDDNCGKHDPRKIFQFIKIGEKLALDRRKVFEKIIRGDPQKAIAMAYPQNLIESLPRSVSINLESWKSEKINLESVHVCYDPNHPEGLIKHWAKLKDGQRYRIWTYGKRRKMQSVDNLASWGISLGQDFAMSSHSYREIETLGGKSAIEFGGKVLSYENKYEKNLFIDELERAESHISYARKTISYPIIAGSDSLTEYYLQKYDRITEPLSWAEANDYAVRLGGYLVTIETFLEQEYISNYYKNHFGIGSSGRPVTYAWIGATDDENQHGIHFEENDTSPGIINNVPFDLNASEGDWKWLNGKDVSDTGFTNWLEIEPNNDDKDYGALNWDTPDGTWVDLNSSYRLPFIIEYKLENEPEELSTTVIDFRKVLVVPARFRDEGWGFEGSSAPLTDQFGNILYPDLQQDAFEPVNQARLEDSMKRVTQYFHENSDGLFTIIPVICPTVTIDLPKYQYNEILDSGGPNPYDSEGDVFTVEDIEYSELGEIGIEALEEAKKVGEKFDFNSNFFTGVVSIDSISGFGDGYESTPVITFEGGNRSPEDLVHPDFKPCQATATVNGAGLITNIQITDPGQYYYSNPTLLVNGSSDFNGTEVNATIGRIGVSWVVISTHEPGAAGVGYVGRAGSHVKAEGGYAGWGVIAHELGHNFGLLHANKFLSRSERPNSDDGISIDYGNPFAVMGSGSGHMTTPAKVVIRKSNGFGYLSGTISGVDVVSLTSLTNLQDAKSHNLHLADSDINNTFRIYRHDYKDPPLSLNRLDYNVTIPTSKFESNTILQNRVYTIKFTGTGDGATAILRTPEIIQDEYEFQMGILQILSGGKGFAEEPILEVLGDRNETLLRIDPSWIRSPAGTKDTTQAILRNLSEGSPRGLRGISSMASPLSPHGPQNMQMSKTWFEYRRDASEYGLSVLIGGSSRENHWIDMTPSTRDDFSDAFLMLGHTFSDFTTDVHITPISKGGVPPMEFIDVAVNIGSVDEGLAEAPIISLDVSNYNPSLEEYIQITANIENNSSHYAYAWYVNEVLETSTQILNKPTFYKVFNIPGEYTVRLVVSDMKGGVSSRNILIRAGEIEKSSLSTLSGTVRAPEGYIQGARVEVAPAKIVEHEVSISGGLYELFLPTGNNNPASFEIDGEIAPDLFLKRGEIHRFNFDQSTNGFPMSFFEHPEYELPKIQLDMLVTPIVEMQGDNFISPPEFNMYGGSSFSTYFSHTVGTIADFQDGLIGSPANPLLVTRPFVKSLLADTNITTIRIRPTETNPNGSFAAYGGKGHHRNNPPIATVHRTSFWENYTEPNATVKAYVDGVATISPVSLMEPDMGKISINFSKPLDGSNFLANKWAGRSTQDPLPEVKIWGSGTDANASVTKKGTATRRYLNSRTAVDQQTINISDQGHGFEPNATMAVLHYPYEPFAMWTFDRHESLYGNATAARFQPTPGWNREILGGLQHYWNFDEENGTEISDQLDAANAITVPELSENNRSVWGAKGRAMYLGAGAGINFDHDALTDHTYSMWILPDDDFSFTISGVNLAYDHAQRSFTLNDDNNLVLNRLSSENQWTHIAIVATSENTGKFYVDGNSTEFQLSGTSVSVDTFDEDSDTDSFEGKLDEVMIYQRAFSVSEIRYLAGRSFLDLSGNKLHAVPVGPDFQMINPDDPITDAGSSTERPTDTTNIMAPGFLGDSYGGEDNGRSVKWDDNDSYIDLSLHSLDFAQLNKGSISFWIRTSGWSGGSAVDQTVFSLSNTDENQTYFRVMVRNIGVMQLHAVNNGIEVAKFYTSSDAKVTQANPNEETDDDWHHVVLVVDDLKSAFWVDGKLATSIFSNQGVGDARAFFSDIENINYAAIGRHEDANYTNSFEGNLDDFYIYDRALTPAEINFLYELRQGREQIPRLQALVDSVGTVKVINGGWGYKELPEIEFSYGKDANSTADLPTNIPIEIRNHGDIENNNSVRSWYVGYAGDQNSSWTSYQRAFATPVLTGTSVEKLLWTKDTFQTNVLSLPNGRDISRRYVEYVQDGNGSYPSPNYEFGAPTGLKGYTSPPSFEEVISDSNLTEDTARAYTLFFLDLNNSAQVISRGIGLDDDFNTLVSNKVRISGKGFQPERYAFFSQSNFLQDPFQNNFLPLGELISGRENWYRSGGELKYAYDQSIKGNPPHPQPLNIEGNGDGIEASTRVDQLFFGPDRTYIFSDWDQNTEMREPRDLDINISHYISHIDIANAGYGYSVPAEVQVVGGYPDAFFLHDWVFLNGEEYQFRRAQLEINATDNLGGILDVQIVDGGEGYRTDYQPKILVTGGGGMGAELRPVMNNGSITDVIIMQPGRGYFNLDSELNMSLSYTPSLTTSDDDANVTPILGGYLDSPLICECKLYWDQGFAGRSQEKNAARRHAHIDPWIEIWDRSRTEAEIDRNGDRAFASAKVRDGVIEKVIVVNGGRGYVDPVVFVRGTPPNRETRSTPYVVPGLLEANPDHFFRYNTAFFQRNRDWACKNERLTLNGTIEICNHNPDGRSYYPPEKCTNPSLGNFVEKCSGTKSNYVLVNDPYRQPWEDWRIFDANLTALVKNGKITEIVVENGGSMYAASDIQVSGSGSRVDVVPIYDIDGFNIDVIYDDPDLKNLETDKFSRPLGAGEGFVNRPWSWDDKHFPLYDPDDELVYIHHDNNYPGEDLVFTHYTSLAVDNTFMLQFPVFDLGELVSPNGTLTSSLMIFEPNHYPMFTGEANEEENPMIFYGKPKIKDALGDRIVDFRINHAGHFSGDRNISATFDFNGSHRPDIDRDGTPDFVDASVIINTSRGVRSVTLDLNATFPEVFDLNGDGNASTAEELRWRSLYVDQPVVNFLPIAGTTEQETLSSFFRLDGEVGFDPEKTSFDLYVDERLPNQFYYGLGSGIGANSHGIGGRISVIDGLPDQLSSEGGKNVYTDQNGFYSVSGLEPGLYTVTVFMEDEDFQESTFRPDANKTHARQVLYVPGLSEKLTMVSDQRGEGISRMVWSKQSRSLSTPHTELSDVNRSTFQSKTLEGVGVGFEPGTKPQLVIIPHPDNTTLGIPKLRVEVLVDGSLRLKILDDITTSSFDLNDQFSVVYSSNISGIDFREDYLFSRSKDFGWAGSKSSSGYGVGRISIFPNDGGGTNPIEVPISSSLTGDQNMSFRAVIYDLNGNETNASNIVWELVPDFNATEGNNSKLATLNGAATTVGAKADIILKSSLRRGRVERVQILAPGSNYSPGSTVSLIGSGIDFDANISKVDTNGGILEVGILDKGSGYTSKSNILINDHTGTGAVLKPILGGGEAILRASHGALSSEVRILASSRTQLTEEEEWLNLYLDTIEERNESWWDDVPDYDLDNDSLSNEKEFTLGTHPSRLDTDGDGLSDYAEIDASALYQTNPLSRDTDGDGLLDGNESVLGTNPLLSDTDGDGLSDYDELLDPELDPLSKDSLLVLSGVMYQEITYPGDLYLKLERGSIDDSNNSSKPIQIYENNESFVRQSNTNFPRAFQFTGLLSNRYYRLSGFIDLNGNQVFDSGEIYIEWEGLLETNKVDLQILFKDLQPDLNFLDQYDDIIEIAKGESFQLSLLATDYPDYNWTGPLVVDVNAATPDILPSIVVSGDATDVLAILNNQADALNSANYGTYTLKFTAFDALGTASVPLERQIIITDKQDPVISVQSNPYPWPLGTPWDSTGIFSANDDPDGNITSKVIVTGFVDVQTIGEYQISLFVRDAFGRTTTEFVTIDVADLSPPTIHFFEGDSSISWLLGDPFILPENYVTVTDNVDADLTTQLEISGLDLLNETEESNQTIYFAVEDSAGNRVENKALTISFQQPAWSITGVAIDGYLSGSVVSFVPSNPALNYLSITGTTNINGGFDLFFLEEDFSKIDTNGNQLIDPSEGTIVVTGGIDTNTNQPFNSALSADANSSVVSPLTTILNEMIKNGTPKADAQTELSKTFGYSNTIDITTYDPIAEAKTGDSDTVAILQANALVVNTFKQVAAVAEHMNSAAESIEVSSQIAKSLAKMANDETSLMDELQKIDVLKDITENTFRVVDPDFEFNEVQMDSFSSVIQNTNQLLAINSMETLSAGETLKKLSQKQIAVEQEVIEGFAQLNQGLIDLDELKNISDVETLEDLSQQINSVNNFAPEGENFEKAFGKSDFELGEILYQLSVTDADGDAVVISVLDSNEDFDLDGDKLQPFGVNTQNQLVAVDVSDVEALLKERNTVTIIFELNDNNGKTNTMQGVLTKENSFENILTDSANQRINTENFTLLDAVLNQETSWYSSDWFGEFYSGSGGWLFHSTLGWLFLHPSGENGFWIWDAHYQSWWWSSKDQNIFPYFYIYGNGTNNTGWGKFENLDSDVRVFEYFKQSWSNR